MERERATFRNIAIIGCGSLKVSIKFYKNMNFWKCESEA
jgi:hypothetical protein